MKMKRAGLLKIQPTSNGWKTFGGANIWLSIAKFLCECVISLSC
jgi:hypothetical protein